jgi:N-acetylmuramoyl-L-alanine amidase
VYCKKIVFSCLFLITSVLCLSPTGSVSAATFSDVPSSHRAYDEIMYLANKNILGGYTDRTFRPDNHVTRAEAASMIGRALKLPGGNRTTEYRDVPKTHYASGFIQDMSDKNILAGYGNGYYGVNDKLTREQMAAIITRSWTFTKTSNITFTDVPTNSPTYSSINKLATAGIVGGYPNGEFGPKDYIKRADFALMLARVFNPDFRSTSTAPTPIAEAQVTADSLNVRSGPSTDAARIGQYPSGTTVKVYSKLSNGWAYVGTDNLKGYVYGTYLRYTSNPLKGRTIIIDPGHGGTDPGALGHGLRESNIVLITSRHVRDYLKAAGANVVMTRNTDVFLSLSQRVSVANNANGEIFVSIHANAFNGSANGTETYYNGDTVKALENKKLATFIHQRMMSSNLGTSDRGVKEGNFQVIKSQVNMPSTLVELAFIDYINDAKKLASDEWRKRAANAIHLGIKDYFYYLMTK